MQLDADELLRAEVDRLAVAVDALPNSPEQIAPPADLKGRIMAIVDVRGELLQRCCPPPHPRRSLGAARGGAWTGVRRSRWPRRCSW